MIGEGFKVGMGLWGDRVSQPPKKYLNVIIFISLFFLKQELVCYHLECDLQAGNNYLVIKY